MKLATGLHVIERLNMHGAVLLYHMFSWHAQEQLNFTILSHLSGAVHTVLL
jgi:hypothetical protein